MRKSVKYLLGAVVLVTAGFLGHSGKTASFDTGHVPAVPSVNGVQCTPDQYQAWKNKNCPKFASLGYHCINP